MGKGGEDGIESSSCIIELKEKKEMVESNY